MDDPEVHVLVWELVDLSTHLRQERLFTISEQANLQHLNTQVSCSSCNLSHLAWITWQQRIYVNKLTVSRPDCSPSMCCHTVSELDNTDFVDAYKILGYQESIHCTRLLEFIKYRPQLLAKYLSVGDRIQPEKVASVVDYLICALYESCLFSDDKVLVLKLLLHLTRLQLINIDDPLRLMRHRSCSFMQLYTSFHEGLYSATLFLTAALHAPIMSLLMEDEKFLDIDPDKASVRFASAEKLRMFGTEGTPEYSARVQKYREWTINKLVSVTNKFIESIRENIHCFPSSVCWLVRHIYKLLINAKKLTEKEVFSICVDLVFTSFICPAIVNPEAYGIVDAAISYVARFNLIQVAKILQMLVMQKYENYDPKVEDLYSHFDKDCLSSIMNMLLEDVMHKHGLDEEPCIADTNSQLKDLCQSPTAFFTMQQLRSFVSFLQLVSASSQLEDTDKECLLELLSPVSSIVLSDNITDVSNTNLNTERNYNSSSSPITNAKKASNMLKAVSKTKLTSALSSTVSNITDECKSALNITADNTTNDPHMYENNKITSETVLVFTLHSKTDTTIGLLTEYQVLDSDIHLMGDDESLSNLACSEQTPQQVQFSSSHSQDEAVSEAVSNQSEDSSMELEGEDQNDNLSDMISANVSGRGSPNISGRDTPSSQVTENYEANNQEENNPPPPPPPVVKQIRFDLDDKFGKFEIKKNIPTGDETISLVSDTWSTDVLASDSETVEQGLNQLNVGLMSIPSLDSSLFPSGTVLPDMSETASEAWSTDVVASDSDRVTEVDTDDTASVARSDITTGTRSEVESRADLDTSDDVSNSQICLLSTPQSYVNEDLGSVDPPSTHSVITSSSSDYMSHVTCIKTTSIIDSNSGLLDDTPALVPSQTENDGISTQINKQMNISIETSSVVIEEVNMVVNVAESLVNDGIVNSDDNIKINQNSDRSKVEIECTTSSVLRNGSAISVSEQISPRPTVTKSISFDKTAEKGDKDLSDDDNRNKRGSFFKNFKFSFKNRRGKSFKFDSHWGDSSNNVGTIAAATASVVYNAAEEESNAVRFAEFPKRKHPSLQIYPLCDTSEDILAKYRPKSCSSSTTTEFSTSKTKDDDEEEEVDNTTDKAPNVEELELETIFDNAKKKLRIVLGTAEIHQLPCTNNNNLPTMKEAWCQHQNVLVAFLQLQLAEAINLKDRTLIAHLHETLRCVRTFDNKRCRKLLESLKKDYKSRAPYLSYLMRCRQTLLSTIAHVERLVDRMKCQQTVCKQFLTLLCVRLFLQKWDQKFNQFSTEFQNLKLSDEKNDFLNNFLIFLNKQIEDDTLWQGVGEEQLRLAKTSVERAVIARVYFYAMFPNGDGDISRDQVLHEHITKLGKVITPNHKDLRIAKKYHNECPWPSAQEELKAITAYKTPQDKLNCILRCTNTIVNLLSLACNRTAPSADHLVPVLVYVLIKANPPSLLSTIQYINSFYSTRLCGEDHYWWVQFCSAVEFTKTMDYNV